ncbi:glycosyltransferase family 9 protein [Pseudomonas sp. CNPSo 3701]|uniref:glycosyltransferase family 9 protein n=1 Tax=Pseudomonas sp. CNPSo 3701 TaxID=3027943 RepID=UPI0023638762|nr:glycosyltransferase family 9 protein [Pseudomonas sp. CNPSo 3701]MDD1510128.1 glycosyltransferase family 9 protein [Pseudomonas sp. CNPSo 3701]
MLENDSLIWPGMKVALVPCPALGDTTLFLWLAWRLQAAGAEVSLCSKGLLSLSHYLPGLTILDGHYDLPSLARSNDLVICALKRFDELSDSELSNVAYLASKKFSSDHPLARREVLIRGNILPGGNNVICRDSRAGKTMTQWIDLYASEILGLDVAAAPAGFQFLPAVSEDAKRRIAIFPTSPDINKNYSAPGFKRLADRLATRGWVVEFVVTVPEQAALQSLYPNYIVHAFRDLKGLVDYLRSCSVVISNDSGGGHIASLLGLYTFTITRRREDFTWRPGFNSLNRVINPSITFKWLGRPIWRPFISHRRLIRELPKW